LLEKCIRLYPEAVTLLDTQYRMHESIMYYSSKVFYNSALMAHFTVAGHLLFRDDLPLTFIDTAGSGFNEKPEGTSVINPEEAGFLFKYLEHFLKTLNSQLQKPSIAVVSPYREQIRLLKETLKSHPELSITENNISVNTIDSFQGQERDMVLISMTRSNSEGQIGFLSDIRRMNVAMTRARKKLVIIGDSATLGKLPFYADLISYAESIDGYKSVWEYLV